MKKAKKFFLNLFILLVAAGAVFFIGWANFYVKPGECAVMETKTGGLFGKPIQNGVFEWRWERLLPTNVKVTTYTTEAFSAKKSFSGTLPGAEVYRTYIDPKPDFNYSMQIQIKMKLTDLGIWSLHKKGLISNQDDLNSYLDAKANTAGQKIMDYFISNGSPLVCPADLTQEQISKIFSDRNGMENMEILSVEVLSCRLPDIGLYESARSAFNEYQTELKAEISQKVQDQAKSIIEENRTMDQLEKFAQLLKKYPELQEFSKNQDITVLMNAIRTLR